MESLFDPGEQRPGAEAVAGAPLAVRMRPRTLDELVGQEHLLAADRPAHRGRVRRAPLGDPLRAARLGQDDLARIIAGSSDAAFEEELVQNAGKAEVRAVIERAASAAARTGAAPSCSLDEIHQA